MLTSIVIATALNPEAVTRVTRCAEENTPENHELIIVDTSPEALGCVKSFNKGMAQAQGDVLIAMNDDCQPRAGWLLPLLDAVDRGIALTSPRWPVARLAGHCLVIPRSTWTRFGPFDERYRHWCADHHLEMLVSDAGLLVGQVYDSVVDHDPSDPLRMHYRKSAFIGNYADIPNTGQWYLEDQAVYESIWDGRYIMSHWGPNYSDWCI